MFKNRNQAIAKVYQFIHQATSVLSQLLVSASLVILLASMFVTHPMHAQIIIHDQWDIIQNYTNPDWERHINYFPSVIWDDTHSAQDSSETRLQSQKHHWNLLPVYTNSIYNSLYASGYNYGPGWQGKGINFTTSAGIAGKFGRVRYVFSPYLVYNQNLDYRYAPDTLNTPAYQYAFEPGIDYVMRYGDSSRFYAHLGQSAIELDLNKVTVSLSTMNFRWGPSIYNPTLMSNNAPGIPHLRIGTSRPLSTHIGDLEAHLFWGLMQASGYQGGGRSLTDGARYFTAMSLGYEPSFFPGFRIGANRIFYTQQEYLRGFWQDGFVLFNGFSNPESTFEFGETLFNDAYDQIVSLSFQYRTPSTPLTFYLDYVRGDFATSLVDFLRQPEHNSGYVMGMFQIFPINQSNSMRLAFEYANLAFWETARIRDSGSLYAHYINIDGYTNRGQIMGAGIGPGSSAYTLQLTWARNLMNFGVEYYRTRFNDDYFYLNYERPENPPQDLEHKVGFIYTDRWGNIGVGGAFYTGIRLHYLYEQSRAIVNIHSKLSLRYYFD